MNVNTQAVVSLGFGMVSGSRQLVDESVAIMATNRPSLAKSFSQQPRDQNT